MKKFNKGFTLIELLAVIAILAIILLIAVPKVLETIADSKKAAHTKSAQFAWEAAEFYIAKQVSANAPVPATLTKTQLDDELSNASEFASLSFTVVDNEITAATIVIENGTTDINCGTAVTSKAAISCAS